MGLYDRKPDVTGRSHSADVARIYLARHGRTALNAAGALRGHIDVPLDPVGQRQVQILGAVLAGRRPQLVVSSPLRRAIQTAEAVADRAGLDVQVDERLIDRQYGEWAGVGVTDVVARWGSLDAAPGVEPAVEVRDRVLAALNDIAKSTAGAAAVVVSHDAVNRIAIAALGPSFGAPDDLPQETGCFNTMERHRKQDRSFEWRVLTINEIPHGEA